MYKYIFVCVYKLTHVSNAAAPKLLAALRRRSDTCIAREHTSAYVRQHASAYVRQHALAYVSMSAGGLIPAALAHLANPLACKELRYSVYLLYWYESTDTDAARSSGTQFTCFTGTKVHKAVIRQLLRSRI